MSPLEYVSLEEVKDHLRVTTSDEDADIDRKIELAVGIILDYLGLTDEDSGWETDTVPPQVKAAILLEVAELWAKRGDEGDVTYTTNTDRTADGYLTPQITRLLHRSHDFTVK